MDIQIDQFDKFVQRADGLPGVKKTRPSTVRSTHSLTGITTTHIVQTYKLDDEGFAILVERVDGEGHYRIVLPGKVAEAIYRQRAALVDRSTPESRARAKRTRELRKKRAAKAAKTQAVVS